MSKILAERQLKKVTTNPLLFKGNADGVLQILEVLYNHKQELCMYAIVDTDVPETGTVCNFQFVDSGETLIESENYTYINELRLLPGLIRLVILLDYSQEC